MCSNLITFRLTQYVTETYIQTCTPSKEFWKYKSVVTHFGGLLSCFLVNKNIDIVFSTTPIKKRYYRSLSTLQSCTGVPESRKSSTGYFTAEAKSECKYLKTIQILTIQILTLSLFLLTTKKGMCVTCAQRSDVKHVDSMAFTCISQRQ